MEQHSLELAKDDHASQRLRIAESLRMYEADVQDANSYLQKLEQSCKADVLNKETRQLSTQRAALEDSKKAMQGKLLDSRPKQQDLHQWLVALNGNKQNRTREALTPVQRAAVEMGLLDSPPKPATRHGSEHAVTEEKASTSEQQYNVQRAAMELTSEQSTYFVQRAAMEMGVPL